MKLSVKPTLRLTLFGLNFTRFLFGKERASIQFIHSRSAYEKEPGVLFLTGKRA
jgi:hypothetical protein